VRIFVLLLVLFWATNSFASLCRGRFVNPVTDICWSCLFPLTIGGASLAKSKVPDTKNPSAPICTCQTGNVPRVGLAVGFWEPARLVEVVREPYCFPTLGGISLGSSPARQGSVSTAQRSFYHVHYFIYPVLYWFNLLTDGVCVEQADLDIAYLSELDPSWNDPTLAFILNAEAVLFNNPAAIAACSADCMSAQTKLPQDKLFWCAGCQGSMFPLTGHVQHQSSGIQGSLLLTERLLYKLHRQGLLWQSAGVDALCYKKPQLIMQKSQYRTQMLYPVALTATLSGGCDPLGRSSVLWEANKQFPIKGEDYAYLIWRKRNCCA